MRIGSYEVVSELGQGGMGVVYAVRSESLPGLRALKLLRNVADPAAVLRFRREAELLARVRHRGVVTIHEVGECDEGFYLVMDLIEGEPLNEVLRRGPVQPERARRWILELADAVAALHTQGILHRDLKPSNLMIRPEGSLLLLDFGLARTAGRSSLTNTGAIAGSPGYMAPEQAEGLSVLGPSVDVHGLGAILYALLSGVAPYEGSSVFEGLKKVLNHTVEWPSAFPQDLARVGAKALSKDPAQRYPDAAAFAAAIQDAKPAKSNKAWLAGVALLAIVLAASALVSTRFSPAPRPSPSPAAPSPSLPGASPGETPLDWAQIPHDLDQRATWYRGLWAEARRRRLTTSERKALRSAQTKRLLDLSVDVSEAPQVRFWGAEHWVRHSRGGLEWGRVDAALPQFQEVQVSSLLPEGEALWGFQYGTWRVFRSPAPDSPLVPISLPLPKAPRSEIGPLHLAAIAEHEGRLALATHKSVWEWSYPKGPLKLLLSGSANEISQIGYTRRGTLLARCKARGATRVYLPAKPLLAGLNCRRADDMAIHPEQEHVAIGDNGGKLQIWSPEDDKATLIWQSRNSQLEIKAVAFGPRGDLLYACSLLENVKKGQLRVFRRGSQGWEQSRVLDLPWSPFSIHVSRDGAWLLISGHQGHGELWAAGDRGY